jgi:hypothetical protein
MRNTFSTTSLVDYLDAADTIALLHVHRIGWRVAGNINDYRIHLGFREVRDAARFGIETSSG